MPLKQKPKIPATKTPKTVRQAIKDHYMKTGCSYTELSKMFGVSDRTCSKITDEAVKEWKAKNKS
jgi:transposase